MKTFEPFLESISQPEIRAKLRQILSWIEQEYPQLQPVIKWNQPMFVDHGTFILGFSASKNHISVTPEKAGMDHFKDEITTLGYEQSMMLFRIRKDQEIPYELIKAMIEYNLLEKAQTTTFWR